MSVPSCVTRSAAAFVAVALVVAGAASSAVAAERPSATRAVGPGVYIVTLADPPAAVYDGGTPGYRATRAKNGSRFDVERPAVAAYSQLLRTEQDRLLSLIGGAEALYQMTTAVNGFVARLDSGQVKALRSHPDVTLVERSTKQHLNTVDSPEFLGAERAWASRGGPDSAGDGMVIGLVDSGIWPENPSFAGLPASSAQISRQLPGFHGACQQGQDWSPEDCNEKVVAARYFVTAFGRGNVAASGSLSPRDGSGHGSHTASAAAGNDGVRVEVSGQRFGTASGLAPAARIAVYKACWTAPDPEDDGCATADAVAAIDQAVADGVDVLNYPISGRPGTITDSVQRAFLNAASGGVFVAAAAGNNGPRSSGVAHAAPWVTTVAASTHRRMQGAVRLPDGIEHVGTMVSDDTVKRAPIVLGAEAASAPGGRDAARTCEPGSLDPAAVQDHIVVCDRGGTSRLDKSAAVALAGGAAMVLANVGRDGEEADLHSVPTVHLGARAARELKAYIRERRASGRAATASLDPSGSAPTAIPAVAQFSSRGPTQARGGDLLKPDLTAPGVGVLAATAPTSSTSALWNLSSGTSTSSAHVAGLAAFIAGVKPRWSPGRIKSAMMTTALPLADDAGPMAAGAGQVNPRRFLRPALVYDAAAADWADLLAGRVRARDLNQPSVSVGSLAGRTTLTREVTNVSGRRQTFQARVSGLEGVSVTVAPAATTLRPNESERFEVRIVANEGISTGSWIGGALTWKGSATGSRTRIPLAVRPSP